MASTKSGPEPTPDDVYRGIQAERVRALNDDEPADGRYVLYWMQASVRAEFNHALEYAVRRANAARLPLLVAFGLMDDYPEANLRHYTFLVQGLSDVAEQLAKRKIPFVVQRGAPDEVALRLAKDAALVVCDRGYLRHQRQWRDHVAHQAGRAVVQVESDVVVPVELVSDKKEHAARTIRPKISKHLDRFLVPLPKVTLKDTTRPRVTSEDVSKPDALLNKLELDRDVPPVPLFVGGTTGGKKVLRAFLRDHFTTYSANRNQPQTDDVSHMSKYLHFGHLSPIQIALEAKQGHAGGENLDDFLEELIIRRELPMNYVFYEPKYDAYEALPEFARKTLAEHRDDRREYVYTRAQLEEAKTHDPYWNAAMNEMKATGYMHNYMRMYWGKKIIEWSKTPEGAFRTTLALNNRWFLDGRDPNSYANVAWVFGQHGRGWTERPIFGTVRWMSASGLERKADPDAYEEKVEQLITEVADRS